MTSETLPCNMEHFMDRGIGLAMEQVVEHAMVHVMELITEHAMVHNETSH